MPQVDTNYIPPPPPLIQDYRHYYSTPTDLSGTAPKYHGSLFNVENSTFVLIYLCYLYLLQISTFFLFYKERIIR